VSTTILSFFLIVLSPNNPLAGPEGYCLMYFLFYFPIPRSFIFANSVILISVLPSYWAILSNFRFCYSADKYFCMGKYMTFTDILSPSGFVNI